MGLGTCLPKRMLLFGERYGSSTPEAPVKSEAFGVGGPRLPSTLGQVCISSSVVSQSVTMEMPPKSEETGLGGSISSELVERSLEASSASWGTTGEAVEAAPESDADSSGADRCSSNG